MATTTCESCGGRVNEAVAACPHCGEKRTAAKPHYTRAEIQALLDADESLRANQGSFAMFSSLVVPHKRSRGFARLAEIVLTGLTLPAVAVGALAIALLGGRRRNAAFSTTGELMPVFVMTVLGGGSIFMWLGTDYAMAAIGALWGRAAVRMISAGRFEREMHALDTRDARQRVLAAPAAPTPLATPKPLPAATQAPAANPAPASALPAARVIAERPSQPVAVRSPEPVKAPEPVKPTAPGDEPSILR